MATGLTKIASISVSSSTYSVTFSSIPSTYTDLLLVFSTRCDYGSDGGYEVEASMNSVTTGYSSLTLYTDGSATGSVTASNPFFTWAGGMTRGGNTANTFANSQMYIPNYAGSNAKSVATDSVTEYNGTNVFNEFAGHINTSTASITSITLYAWQSFINFVSGSTFYLYGIKSS